jgi:GT2 family glycosyltransferase
VDFFLKLGFFKSSIYDYELRDPRIVPYVLFACVLFEKDVTRRVGLLDEDFRFYHEDCDYGYRLFTNEVKQFIVPGSTITHIGGGSSSKNSVFSFENYYYGLLRFYKKHRPAQFRVLQATLVLVFIFRSFATIFGRYTTLSLPSTYGFDHGLQPFASPFKRCRYYLGFMTQITAV